MKKNAKLCVSRCGGYIQFIALFLAVVFVGAAVIYLYPKYNLSTESVSASPLPVSSQVDETSDWKTYTNEDYGFEFKYPETWGKGAVCEGDEPSGLIRFGESLLKYPYSNCGTANIPSPVMFYFKQKYNPYPGYIVEHKEEGKIGDKNFNYFVYKIISRENAGPEEFSQVVIPLRPDLFLIGETNSSDTKNIFDQILSTFKFTDNLSSPQPTCVPRPKCLDSTPRCMIPETSDMCAK